MTFPDDRRKQPELIQTCSPVYLMRVSTAVAMARSFCWKQLAAGNCCLPAKTSIFEFRGTGRDISAAGAPELLPTYLYRGTT